MTIFLQEKLCVISEMTYNDGGAQWVDHVFVTGVEEETLTNETCGKKDGSMGMGDIARQVLIDAHQ